jgi:hypothetical protein
MKTFKQFLFESNRFTPMSKFSFVEQVRDKCSEFLRANDISENANCLYRGIKKGSTDLYIHGVPRSNRDPSDMPKRYHDAIDEYFSEKFGFKYRSGGAFVSNSKRATMAYGAPYLFIPMNGYKLCGSDRIEDLYSEMDVDPIKSIMGVNRDDPKSDDLHIDLRDLKIGDSTDRTIMNKIMDSANYFESKKVEEFGQNEIMVQCKGFYMMQFNDTGYENVTEDVIQELYK